MTVMLKPALQHGHIIDLLAVVVAIFPVPQALLKVVSETSYAHITFSIFLKSRRALIQYQVAYYTGANCRHALEQRPHLS